MKRIILIALLFVGLGLGSCDSMGHKTDSSDCSDRMNVVLMDGSEMYVYGGKVYDGYVKGNDENKQIVYIPMHQVISVTVVNCQSGNDDND